MKTQSSRIVLSVAASLLLVAAGLVDAANAGRGQGGGGGRGGGGQSSFSRSGPAASGSFSSQRSAAPTASRQAGATQRSGQRTASAQTASRQAGATERSGQRAQTQQTRTESRASTRTSGQQERTEREGQRQQGQTERTEARQQGQTERTEARSSAAQNISGDWDSHHYDDDNEWGYALAGAAVGATVGYVAGAAMATPTTVVSAPTYVTVLPCTPTVVESGGASYYGCGGSWYNRSYVNGSVAYVTVSPPPGY